MSSSLDTLRHALRLSPCKWLDCPVVLSSWDLLEKHTRKVHASTFTRNNRGQKVHKCQFKPPKGKLCGLTFDDPDKLLNHMINAHYTQQLYLCPVQDCRLNLRRYRAEDAVQEHLAAHVEEGVTVKQAIPIALTHTPLPPIPSHVRPTYEAWAGAVLPKAFKRAAIQRIKQEATEESKVDVTQVSKLVTQNTKDDEEEDSPAEMKPRKLKEDLTTTSKPVRLVVPRSSPQLPPLFQGGNTGPPDVSVGFESNRFLDLAKEAFEEVAAEDLEPDSDSSDSDSD